MRQHDSHRTGFLAATLVALSLAPAALAAGSAATAPQAAEGKAAGHDGTHDFDPLLGTWKYHLSRLEHPLSGSTKWLEYEGTGTCQAIWDGSQLDTLDAHGPAGHIQGLVVRLYNPQSHQWSLNWVARGDSLFGPPPIGAFKNGRGEFFDQEMRDGRAILVRFAWSDMTATSAHFEQAFSEDGGKTWETNWITDQVRVGK
jgi:hypothetical protein